MDCEKLFNDANEAAKRACIEESTRRPENGRDADCGFAWVTIRPAKGPFVLWCKKQINNAINQYNDLNSCRRAKADAELVYGDRAHNGGWQFWKPGNFDGQSVRIHLAGSEAFARVLREAGLEVHVGSRLD